MPITELDMVTGQIEMLREALAEHPATDADDKRAATLARYEQRAVELRLVGGGLTLPTDVANGKKVDLTKRPEAGSAASNQFGTFKVRYATEPQHRFMQSLIARKDIRHLAEHRTMPLDPAEVVSRITERRVNKRAASDLIDRLLACPDRPGTVSAAGAPKASDKQLGLIRKLLGEKAITPEDRAKVEAALDTLSTKGASATIDKLMALPKTTVPTPAIELAAGMYIDDTTGEMLRVYLGQQSGQLLCKKVVKVEAPAEGEREYDLEYQGRADRFVTAAYRRMNLDEAKVWGKATGHCCVCARRLDVPESVDAGIGPKCAGRI